MMGLIEKFYQICSSGNAAGPVSNEVIDQAQERLGVKFPVEYRDFLAEFGALIFDGGEIYGLPHTDKNAPSIWQNVISVTQQLQSWGQVGIERPGFIPITDDGTGVYYFLDTKAAPQSKIWAIGQSVNKEVSDSFSKFIVSFAEKQILD